jgi:hypothetical protein
VKGSENVRMKQLLYKLNFRAQKRIALINASDHFVESLIMTIPDVQIDREIDPRFPYEFMLFFVKNVHETEVLVPRALHNLVTDGILWFAYPKKTSRKIASDIDREHGWEVLLDRGFEKVRLISINEEWSALRFRNIRFIKSSAGRFSH